MHPLAGLKHVLSALWPHEPEVPFLMLFKKFKSILDRNAKILEIMADMGDKLSGEYVFDRQYILSACENLNDQVFKLISDLSMLTQRKNLELFQAFERIRHQINEELAGRHCFPNASLVLPLEELNRDSAEEAGNKFAMMGELRNTLHMPTPEGFVVTTKAYFDFMAHNRLPELISSELAGWRSRGGGQVPGVPEVPGDLEAAEPGREKCPLPGPELWQNDADFLDVAARVRQAILSAEVPRALASAITAQREALSAGRVSEPRFAVRSSAWGEDGESSFAGQYETVLNVRGADLLSAYREVVASVYSPEAWQYRLQRNYSEADTAMAVGCQLMVEAEVSGGMYSYAPMPDCDECLVVSAAWGLGAPVVNGTAETDTFVLERTSPYKVVSRELGTKATRLVCDPEGGTRTEPVPDKLQRQACLTPERLLRLAQAGMTIERYSQRPQDVEWAFDAGDNLCILQARPLNMSPRLPEAQPKVQDATRDAEVVFQGRGIVAQHGVGIGKVFVVREDKDLLDFPHGSILVSRYTSPRFSRVMRKAQGIITDVGSPTGHMSTIAREYRVPTVVNTGLATRLLRTGETITLDTTGNSVYRGAIPELCRFQLSQEDVFQDSQEYRMLRRLLKRISPLNMLDPHSKDFRPGACRTYHDITRYIHEKAVEELIHLSEHYRKHLDTTPRRLITEIPMGLTVIDIEDGLRPDAMACATDSGNGEVRSEDLASQPLIALLEGVMLPGMWCTDPVDVDLGSFMSSFTRTFSSAMAAPDKVGRNLAVISREYLNLNLRLGYHYTVVDAFITDEINANTISFRFMGGVTGLARRNRRARFVAHILERFDFRVEVHGDLVAGGIKKLARRRMLDRMRVIGGLIGYTRQLDVRLTSDEDLPRFEEEFMTRIASLLEVPRVRH